METIDKFRVILKHWIDHNGGHVAEFDKWRGLMEAEGKNEIADSLEEAKRRMDNVSELLGSLLEDLGGAPDEEGHHHHHHHH
jgi:hypothetical protein